jgi:hypothetical protein
MVLCTARYPEPEDIKIAGKHSGKTSANVFSKRRGGQTRWGAARSKAGEASLNDASVCSNRR